MSGLVALLAPFISGISRVPRIRWLFYRLCLDYRSPLLARLRWHFWRVHFTDLGPNTVISYKVTVRGYRNVRIGSNSRINHRAFIDGRAGLSIGSDVLIGFEAIIISSTHRFEDPHIPIRLQGNEGGPVHIGDDVWVGTRAIIMPGVTIGTGAVIGAGSIVTRDVEPYMVVVGVPARPIRLRGKE